MKRDGLRARASRITGRRPSAPPVYAHPDHRGKIEGSGRHLGLAWLENVFFFVVMLMAFAFAVMLLKQAAWSWSLVFVLIVFWAVMSYLALPRLHRVLTSIYVPDYFIGRTRTTDGLLGDPLNLALTGDERQIHSAMRLAGWTRADPVTLGTSVRIVIGSLLRRSYPEAPVSPLVLFGKTQAFAYQQEVEGNPSQRHHMRFWPVPDGWLLPGGYRVDWLASGTYDRAVGLSFFTLQVTHRIDRNIDVERDYIVDSLRHAVAQVEVDVIRDFSTGYHSRNGGGDAVVTDGDLPIIRLDGVEVPPGASAVGSTGPALLGQVGRRPATVVAAVALAVASALVAMAGLVWRSNGGTLGPSGPDVLGDASLGISNRAMLWIGVLAYVPILVLAWRTYAGGVWARLTMIAVVTISQAGQMWQYLQGTRPTASAMLALAMDLLMLYALTSLSAREWAESGRAENEGVDA